MGGDPEMVPVGVFLVSGTDRFAAAYKLLATTLSTHQLMAKSQTSAMHPHLATSINLPDLTILPLSLLSVP